MLSKEPNVKDSEQAMIKVALVRSLNRREIIHLEVFDAEEDLVIEGVLDYFDPGTGTFAVDGEQFDLSRIVTATYVERS